MGKYTGARIADQCVVQKLIIMTLGITHFSVKSFLSVCVREALIYCWTSFDYVWCHKISWGHKIQVLNAHRQMFTFGSECQTILQCQIL